MRAPLILLLLILLPSQGYAGMYKWTNDEGDIIYSDTPPNNDAEEVILPELNTTPALKVEARPEPTQTPDESAEATSYTEFQLVNPEPDAIIRDNTGNVSVSLSLQPELDSNAGHSINILIDGEASISNSQQTTVTLTNIDRGTHTVSAEIIDSTGKVIISSNSVSFTVFRYSKLH